VTTLTDAELAVERMDAFDRFDLAEHACEQFAMAAVQDPERGAYLAAVLDETHDAWLVTRDEQRRRRRRRD
jgi:hypothetical protein